MGLLGDIQEVKELWERGPWRVKIYLGLTLFLSVSSIASLAEEVANWKGFLLAGVQFYQSYLRDPFFSLISDWLSLSFTDQGADTVAIMGVITMVTIRRHIFFIKHRKKPTTLIANPAANLGMELFLFVCLIYLIGNYGDFFADKTIYFLSIALYMFLTYIGFRLKSESADFLLLFVYLAVPPALVCLAAAVNLGLYS